MFYDENVSMAGTLNLKNLNGHVNGIFSSFPLLQLEKPILIPGGFFVGLSGLRVLLLQFWKGSCKESSKWAGDGS